MTLKLIISISINFNNNNPNQEKMIGFDKMFFNI